MFFEFCVIQPLFKIDIFLNGLESDMTPANGFNAVCLDAAFIPAILLSKAFWKTILKSVPSANCLGKNLSTSSGESFPLGEGSPTGARRSAPRGSTGAGGRGAARGVSWGGFGWALGEGDAVFGLDGGEAHPMPSRFAVISSHRPHPAMSSSVAKMMRGTTEGVRSRWSPWVSMVCVVKPCLGAAAALRHLRPLYRVGREERSFSA